LRNASFDSRERTFVDFPAILNALERGETLIEII
jgi:hypothetical protein